MINLSMQILILTLFLTTMQVMRCVDELMPGSLGARDNSGDTPAHLAARNGHVEVLCCIYEPESSFLT